MISETESWDLWSFYFSTVSTKPCRAVTLFPRIHHQCYELRDWTVAPLVVLLLLPSRLTGKFLSPLFYFLHILWRLIHCRICFLSVGNSARLCWRSMTWLISKYIDDRLFLVIFQTSGVDAFLSHGTVNWIFLGGATREDIWGLWETLIHTFHAFLDPTTNRLVEKMICFVGRRHFGLWDTLTGSLFTERRHLFFLFRQSSLTASRVFRQHLWTFCRKTC